jgi:serine/threonine protein kinase
LKPSNLLLNANCDLKICDFGLARTNSEKEYMTEYVVTRWYRAPELLLSCAEYTAAIDIWSVGCIFAELLGRKPLFPGKDYVHQLNLITRVLGSPDPSDLEFIDSEKAKRYMRSLPHCQRVVLGKYYPHSNPLALDLIDKMLQFNPHKRITVEEALSHPYMATLHDLSDEPCCPQPFYFPLDDGQLNGFHIRDLIFEDIQMNHPEHFQ